MASMTASPDNEAPVQYINREHTTLQYVFILSSVAMCITVDILQYSMPLAFLPSVLEDRGHSPEMIATAIGVYYWTGLLGGTLITSYQIWKLFYRKETQEVDITPFTTVQTNLKLVIFSLGIGVATLCVQAMSPRWHVHTACRFIQGFVGAFLFFYVFLLCVAIFKGQQQVVAMSCYSCATVLAELAGPLLGSVLYDAYGQRSVFWFLGFVSFLNQGMLLGVLFTVRSTEEVGSASPSRSSSPILADTGHRADKTSEDVDQPRSFWKPLPGTWEKLMNICSNRTFICASLMITMAGVIKGSVEEMLPFHADHQWGYDPLQIGKLFCVTAVAYFLASALVAEFWIRLGRLQVGFSAHCILLLGISSCMAFHIYHFYKDETLFYGTMAAYGFCAGLAFTSAAQLIAEVVDHAEGQSKDVGNGLWNTAWEAGGSTGFFLGGFLADRYNEQMMLTTWHMICTVGVAIAMFAVGGAVVKSVDKASKGTDYGAAA